MGKLRVEFDVLIDRTNPSPDPATLAEGTHVTVDLNELVDCKYAEVRNLVIAFTEAPKVEEVPEEVIVGAPSTQDDAPKPRAKVKTQTPAPKKKTTLRRK